MELEIAKKIANVEVIPKGWRLGLVGEDCKICNNLRKPINEADRDAIAGIYPYYGPTGILGYINEYRLDGEYALIGEDGDHFLKYDRQPMTLLINGRNNVNNHAHIIQGTDKCSAAWFYNYFKHKNLSNVLSRQGAGRYKLNKATLEKLPILLPTPQEQNEICKMIAVWDEVIICLQKTIETKREHKSALMQRLLTGKLRFPEFSGKKWSPLELADICIIKKGQQLNKTVLTKEGLYPAVNGGIAPSGYTDKWNIEANTVTISEGGNSCGFVSWINKRFWCGGHCYALINPKIDSKFLYQFLKGQQNQIMRLRVGSGLPNIQKSDLESFVLLVPESSEEQRKIAAVLSAADREIDQLTQKLDAYKLQKKGLMQQLLTGKKRVGIAKSEAA